MSIRKVLAVILVGLILTLAGCTTQESLPSTPSAILPLPSSPDPTLTPKADEIVALMRLISQDQVFAYLEDLTSIQSYSGWRNSATEGEAEAIGYIAETLGQFTHLQSLGLELEQQNFHVYLATEIWESRLFLTLNGQESEVPSNAISGHRKVLEQALRFDSDGTLNDADRNPVEVVGDTLLARSVEDVQNLAQDEVKGKIVFLDFDAVDPAKANQGGGAKLVTSLIRKGVAGLVLVTESGSGKYAGDGTILESTAPNDVVPMLNIRLEDLSPAGVASWEALAQIEKARLIWDTDVFSPGQSGNLVARIPGADPSRAVILGAHIDSANSPGAGDNGLNCAALMEFARVLDEGKVQPPVDIYMVWFGSHELGFYGSQHFVNTHQDVLDRTLAAVLMDGFTADRPGPTIFGMQESSYARFGDASVPLSDYLTQKAERYGIAIDLVGGSNIFSSDDGPFYGFVPGVRFAFGNNRIGNGFHSPYDTLANVQDQGEVMEQTVGIALITAFGIPQDAPEVRLIPESKQRALIVASHTEVLHMTPTMLTDLDQVLAWEGFDVDVIPYGQSLSSNDFMNADLVLVLPVIDYPRADDETAVYDEEWSTDEIDLLANFVEQGGLLVLTNSDHRIFMGELSDSNEDWDEVNALAEGFGIRYEGDPFLRTRALVASEHPLVENLSSLIMIANNGLPIHLKAGVTLAEIDGQTALGLVGYGDAGGQVLALADLGMLDLYDFGRRDSDNFSFLRNLARFAHGRWRPDS